MRWNDFPKSFHGRLSAAALPTASITKQGSLGAVAQRLEAAPRVPGTQTKCLVGKADMA